MHGMVAASVVAEQCRRLAAEGSDASAVYALNRAELPLAIVHLLKAAGPSRRHALILPGARLFFPRSPMTDFLDYARERLVLFDGGMGTQIQGRTLTLDDFWGQENCSEILNLSPPGPRARHPRGYLRAGADAVETNTFGGSPITLGEFGLADTRLRDQQARLRARFRGDRASSPATAGAASSSARSAPARACPPRPRRLPAARGRASSSRPMG